MPKLWPSWQIAPANRWLQRVMVVSNTSPLRYLIAVGRVELVENIFGHVMIPRAVQQWLTRRPIWLQVRDLPQPPEPELFRRLDRGEAEAIQLAINLRADFLLIDEFRGRRDAAARGVTVIEALGILLESYRQRRIDNPLEILA